MNRFIHFFSKVIVLGIAVMLILVLFCGYADEVAAVPEGEAAETAALEELPEAEAFPSPEIEEATEETESFSDANETGENVPLPSETLSPLPEDEIPLPEPVPESTPTPTPTATPIPTQTAMPMFDIIDGRTIYLSITEEEFIEIAGILREGLGVNDAALAGIMGNLQGESGFNPHKVGDDGGAFGICQWRGARLDQMVAYCEEHDLNPVSRDGQLSFLIYDLVNNYVYAYDQIRLCEDSERGALEATYNFCAYYEVPSNPEEESVAREEWTKLLIFPKLNELSEAA